MLSVLSGEVCGLRLSCFQRDKLPHQTLVSWNNYSSGEWWGLVFLPFNPKSNKLLGKHFHQLLLKKYPGYQSFFFSRVRRGASSARGRPVFGRRPKTRAAKRGSLFLRLDRNRKPPRVAKRRLKFFFKCYFFLVISAGVSSSYSPPPKIQRPKTVSV